MLSRATASYRRIMEVLETDVDLKDRKRADKSHKFKGNVTFEHVYFKYDRSHEKYILKDINFSVKSGETVAIIGGTGAGKTTLIGKLAHRFKSQGEKVLLVAGDTFRAAAEEQLDVWSKRAGVDILREDKADSASLAYRSIDMARKDGYNVVIIDSAGRLQNKFNLIEELKKIKNVISKKIENDNLETLLVLDGSQGQNGLNQAMVFNEAVDISALAITKLDGTPKGGIIFSITKNLKIPTKLIGIGEGIDDVIDFNKDDFVNALFE